MRKMKRIISLLVAVIMITSLYALPASASTSSAGTATRTITVNTGSGLTSPYIILSQSKGTITYSKTNWLGRVTGTKTKSLYGVWKIRVKATDGSLDTSTNWSSSGMKIKLKKNKTYIITVSWSVQNTITLVSYTNGKWSKYPYWTVSKTSKIRLIS